MVRRLQTEGEVWKSCYRWREADGPTSWSPLMTGSAASPNLLDESDVRAWRRKAGELGALGDALVVAVGAGGVLPVLATSLYAWLSQPRRSDVRIRIQGQWRAGCRNRCGPDRCGAGSSAFCVRCLILSRKENSRKENRGAAS